MEARDLIRLPDPRESVRAEVREVVRDIFDRPHVFIRVRLTGWNFPHRAPEPFLVIGEVLSRFVTIHVDGSVADAYFDKPFPRANRVSFGYGNVISWDFDVSVDPEKLLRLDRARLSQRITDPFSERLSTDDLLRAGDAEGEPIG